MGGIITTQQIYRELLALRKDVKDLKSCFHEDFLELAPEVVKTIQESRKRMKNEFVSHEEMRKEFGK